MNTDIKIYEDRITVKFNANWKNKIKLIFGVLFNGTITIVSKIVFTNES